jgi:subtilisin-like proprotein convertase family protein
MNPLDTFRSPLLTRAGSWWWTALAPLPGWGARVLAAGLAGLPAALGAPVFQTVGQAIPEYAFDSPPALVSTVTVTGESEPVGGVRVFLEVSGEFNGDLFVYLTHLDHTSILLNRAGRSDLREFGYGDPGLTVAFQDDAQNGDIHTYRLALYGSHSIPVAVPPLTGFWAPDGRNVDPASVTELSVRDAPLAVFLDLPRNGDWSLFATDCAAGNTQVLERWGIEFIPVPEPSPQMLLSVAAVVAMAGAPRRCGRLR